MPTKKRALFGQLGKKVFLIQSRPQEFWLIIKKLTEMPLAFLYPDRSRLLIPIVLLALCLIRFIHLGADTPGGISSDIALYVDEGYKTLSPRNLILFGTTGWHPQDEYQGWMRHSALTQWAYYLAFRLFGMDIQSARAVTIAWFFVFLLGYTYAMSNEYPRRFVYLGLLALGLESTLFFLSRMALFEIPIITCIYGLLFILKRFDHVKPAQKIAVVVAFTLGGSLLIKPSAIIYLIPILCGTIIASGYIREAFRKSWCSLVFLIFALFVVYQMFSDIAFARMDLSPFDVVERVLLYPQIGSSSFIVLLGLLCPFYILCLSKADVYHDNAYLLSLLLMVLLCPLILALFDYNPARYYVPIIPAYILLCLECLHLRRVGKLKPAEKPASYSLGFIGIGILLQTIMVLASFVNRDILVRLPFAIGEQPGISSESMYKWFSPVAMVLACMIYVYRNVVWRKVITVVVSVLLTVCITYNTYILASFFGKPSYHSSHITKEILSFIPHDATVAGDWAPFFMMNTKVKVIYSPQIGLRFNHPSKVKSFPADYFLIWDDSDLTETRRTAEEMVGAKLGQAVYKFQYSGKDIMLYPVNILSD